MRKTRWIKNFVKQNILLEKNCIEELHEEFKSLRNAVINNLRKSKEKHDKQYFDNSKRNLWKTWNGIKKSRPRCIKINKPYVPDKKEIVKNGVFSNSRKQVDSKTLRIKWKITDYLKLKNQNSFFLDTVNEKELQCVISYKLQTTKQFALTVYQRFS